MNTTSIVFIVIASILGVAILGYVVYLLTRDTGRDMIMATLSSVGFGNGNPVSAPVEPMVSTRTSGRNRTNVTDMKLLTVVTPAGQIPKATAATITIDKVPAAKATAKLPAEKPCEQNPPIIFRANPSGGIRGVNIPTKGYRGVLDTPNNNTSTSFAPLGAMPDTVKAIMNSSIRVFKTNK